MSSDPATAYGQGRTEAYNAAVAAINLGFSAGTVLYLDIERYTNTPTCQNAVREFTHGWSQWMFEWGGRSTDYGL